MTLINWVIISLILSIIGNICCIWYIRRLLSKVLFISENLTDLVDVLDTYRNHLKKIYSLEMFHGDETIQFLIRHTNSLLDILEDYRDIYQMTDPLEITNSQEEEEEYDEETQRAETIHQKDVFYGGTRSSNS